MHKYAWGMGLVKTTQKFFLIFLREVPKNRSHAPSPAMKKPWEDLMDVQEEDVSLVNEPDAEMVHQ